MTMRWENSLSAGLEAFATEVHRHHKADLAEGVREQVLPDAIDRTPVDPDGDVRHPPLSTTGRVRPDRGRPDSVAITFDGPYARWIHEHVNFKHPRGGQAKFLETALYVKGLEGFAAAARRLWRRA